jgi:hypothetical protein
VSSYLPVVGTGLSIGASFLQARSQAQMAKAQMQVENAQLKIDRENERIKGMQDANARQEEYLRNEAANRAAMAASGVGIDLAYDDGLGGYNKRVAQRDLQSIDFNTGQRTGRISYQIRVNKANARNAATSAYIGAAANAAGAVGSLMSRPGGMLE